MGSIRLFHFTAPHSPPWIHYAPPDTTFFCCKTLSIQSLIWRFSKLEDRNLCKRLSGCYLNLVWESLVEYLKIYSDTRPIFERYA
ncbi:hypothetical protein Lalb_Chr15g0086461 [Lupinus albus]|uniref:Uncharacterized protein n=1 Tax=Lupinus albus TaxID=3870 RepID=A0A6A4P2M4_LUPAL|nr:hypothetical protein Lalb_Chr15g0086461 [Lupinus albus]